METEKIKQLYECLLKSGELTLLYRELKRKGKDTNCWENDKEVFIKLYNDLNQALHFEVDNE